MAPIVLIVDDDPVFLSLAARLLAELDAEVYTATSAETAIAEAAARRPQAVLVDVGLPDRDGLDLAQELAGSPWAPRVVLTSSDPDSVAANADPQAEPGLAFVPKEELTVCLLRSLLLGP